MERLWSPWRMAFISGEAGSSGASGCIFCDHLAEGDDERAGILWRGRSCFALLNAFPYNTGHLMVAPLRHAGDLTGLTADERAELMELTSRSVAIVREVVNAEG